MNKRYGILIVSVTILVLGFVGTASATNWSVDGSGGADFTGIQDAINNAKDGDTILVYSGVYYENVVVNKSVTLKGIGYPVVDASKLWLSTIRLTADGITLAGFTATKGSGLFGGAGIAVASNNNNITGNNARHNTWGIQLYDSSNNNTITGNNASNNSQYGILLSTYNFHPRPFSSSNNTITGNNVCNNEWGICLHDSNNNNTITGNNVCNNENGGIGLFSSSSNNAIAGNTLSNNDGDGICLHDSSNNNTITGNNVCNNKWDGIDFFYSSNNHIYFNNIINNTDSPDYSASCNIWNSPLEITYTYDGTTYESYLGNYWDDYEGTDADGDGIGNTPYRIYSESGERDDYPLMKPFENYIELVVGEHSL